MPSGYGNCDQNIELPSLADFLLIMLNLLLENNCPQSILVKGLALLSQHGAVQEILMKDLERFLNTVKALLFNKETILEEAEGSMK